MLVRNIGCVLFAYLVASTLAIADQLTVTIGGTGSYRIGDTSEQKINGLTFVSVNGRSQYVMQTTAGLIAFSGGKDFQPSATDYLLNIDQLISLTPESRTNNAVAAGQCKMKQSEDGMYVYSVVCSAQTAFGEAVMAFTGGTGRVQIFSTPVKRKKK